MRQAESSSSTCRRSARWRGRRSTPGRRSRAARGGCRAASSPPRRFRPTWCAPARRREAGPRCRRWRARPRAAFRSRRRAGLPDRVRTPSAANALHELAGVPVDAVDNERDQRRGSRQARRQTRQANEASSSRRSTLAAMEAFAGLDRRDDHLGRAEQHRVDRVEVALEALEDLGEGLAVVARAIARQRLRQLAGVLAAPVTNRCTRPA